jgi:hypothetical protein
LSASYATISVSTTVRNVSAHSPTMELCGFTVGFVRKYWQLRPDVTGSYQVPVYYGFN